MGDLIYLQGEEVKVFEDLLALAKADKITHAVFVARLREGRLVWRTVSNPKGSWTYLIGLCMRIVHHLSIIADEEQGWKEE